MENREYDWQKFINDCDKDENGRIIISEEDKAEHFKKMREVNKNYNWEGVKTRFNDKPKDKNGYLIISGEDHERARRLVNWVEVYHPNCNYMPFTEQDKIMQIARKALNL